MDSVLIGRKVQARKQSFCRGILRDHDDARPYCP